MIYDQIHDFARNITQEGALLSIDYGGKRMGIAISDPGRIIASPVETYNRRNIAKDLGYLARIIRENNIVACVIGLPLDENGLEGNNCKEVRDFAMKLLKKTQMIILLHDERFSTSAVTKSMQDAGVKRKNRHQVDDKLAATYILQNVLDIL